MVSQPQGQGQGRGPRSRELEVPASVLESLTHSTIVFTQDASVQVTLSRLRAQNRVHIDRSEDGLPGRQGLASLNVAVCFTLNTPRVLGEGLLLGQQIIHGRNPENIWRCSENNQMGTS